MLFYVLISVVFIAEIVIAGEIIRFLFKSIHAISQYNNFFDELKPKLKDLMKTLGKISEQLTELAPMVVNSIKSAFTNFVIGHIKNLIIGVVFVVVKKEIEKRIN